MPSKEWPGGGDQPPNNGMHPTPRHGASHAGRMWARVMPSVMPLSNVVRSIKDKHFDQSLTLRDAYRTMYAFLLAYHERGESETGVLLGDITLLEDGVSADPAQMEDFANAFEKMKERDT